MSTGTIPASGLGIRKLIEEADECRMLVLDRGSCHPGRVINAYGHRQPEDELDPNSLSSEPATFSVC